MKTKTTPSMLWSLIALAVCHFGNLLPVGMVNLFAQLPPDSQAARYGNRIVVPDSMQPTLKAAVADLRETLSQISHSPFEVLETKPNDAQLPATGIILVRHDSPLAPQDAVKLVSGGSRESIALWPDQDRLWMVSPTDLGLGHAVYLYLEQLGCRWYFPSEKWTFLPNRADLRIKHPVQSTPAFRSRVFFGTGGFGGNLPLDPDRSLQHRWEAWERRNRFGGEIRVSGHSGEAFNLRHQKELEQHPEWRAMLDGKREPWSLSTKLCVGNQDAVDLYVRDRIDEFRTQKKQNSLSPWAWAVSVDPADGGGHCTAPESVAIGSISDRVFHVANETAKSLRKEFPEGWVSLFGYGEHAAVPSIPLEPNIYVVVIPYAFQRTGLSPDELLDAWSRKVPRMGVYDYWSIPDWTHDLPDFDPFRFGPERMRGWHRRGIDSFLCESTCSSGAMGLAWQVASRLAWNPDLEQDPICNQFLNDCFGSATSPMERMLKRWSAGFCLTSHELGLSFRDLGEASRLAADDPGCLARIADYGRYVEYLRRRFEYTQTELAPLEEQREAAERLMVHLWRIHGSSMVHAFRLAQLLDRDQTNRKNPELGKKYDWRDPKAPGWSEIQPLNDAEVLDQIRKGNQDFQPQPFVARQYGGRLKRVNESALTAEADAYCDDFWLNDSLELFVLAEQGDQTYQFKIGTERPVRITTTDPDGKLIDDQSAVTGEGYRSNWTTVAIKFSMPGLHRLVVDCPKRMYRVAIPRNVRSTMKWWTNSQGTPTPRLYFYVPQGIDALAIYTDYVDAGLPKFFDPRGTEVLPQALDKGHLMVIPIAKSDQGAIWSLSQAKCAVGPLRMLNAPSAFSLAPEMLLVPEEAFTGRAR